MLTFKQTAVEVVCKKHRAPSTLSLEGTRDVSLLIVLHAIVDNLLYQRKIQPLELPLTWGKPSNWSRPRDSTLTGSKTSRTRCCSEIPNDHAKQLHTRSLIYGEITRRLVEFRKGF